MSTWLDIYDALLVAWPVCSIFACFLLARYIYAQLRHEWTRRAYAAYEARMRHEWKSIGYDAWLEAWEAQEQEQER